MKRRGFLGALAAGVAALTAGKLPAAPALKIVTPSRPEPQWDSAYWAPEYMREAIRWLHRNGWSVEKFPDCAAFRALKRVAVLRRQDSGVSFAVAGDYVPRVSMPEIEDHTLVFVFKFEPLAHELLRPTVASRLVLDQVKSMAAKAHSQFQ